MTTIGSHSRLQIALRANGLQSDGSFQECLDRLLGAGACKRTHSVSKKHEATTTSVQYASFKANVCANLRGLDESLRTNLGAALLGDGEHDIDAIATALMDCPRHSGLESANVQN